MKNKASAIRSLRWIAGALAMGLAWTGALYPGMASAQMSSDTLSIDRLDLQVGGRGGVLVKNVNRLDLSGDKETPTVEVRGADRIPEYDLTTGQERDILPLVAALHDGDENTLMLEADLAPYGISGTNPTLIRIHANFRMDNGDGRSKLERFAPRNIIIEPGEGELDPDIAALLEGLMPYFDAPAATQEASKDQADEDGVAATGTAKTGADGADTEKSSMFDAFRGAFPSDDALSEENVNKISEGNR